MSITEMIASSQALMRQVIACLCLQHRYEMAQHIPLGHEKSWYDAHGGMKKCFPK